MQRFQNRDVILVRPQLRGIEDKVPGQSVFGLDLRVHLRWCLKIGRIHTLGHDEDLVRAEFVEVRE